MMDVQINKQAELDQPSHLLLTCNLIQIFKVHVSWCIQREEELLQPYVSCHGSMRGR